MSPPAHPTSASSEGGFWKQCLRRDGWAVLIASLMTLAVSLGLYVSVRFVYGGEYRTAMLATLAVLTLWVPLAASAMSFGGAGNLSALLRSGAIVDTSGLVLVVLWVLGLGLDSALSFGSIVKMYCILASVGIMVTVAVCCGRSMAARAGLAVFATGIVMVALASPFWIKAWIDRYDAERNVSAVTWAVRVNPFYAVLNTVPIAWHQQELLYDRTGIGSDYGYPILETNEETSWMEAATWYVTAGMYLLLALALTGIALLRWKVGRYSLPSSSGEVTDLQETS